MGKIQDSPNIYPIPQGILLHDVISTIYLGPMSPKEMKCIESLLSDIYGGLCEGDEPITMHVQLDELYEVIKRLMDATFQATDTEMKVRLAQLEYRAREYRQTIQDRLGMSN